MLAVPWPAAVLTVKFGVVIPSIASVTVSVPVIEPASSATLPLSTPTPLPKLAASLTCVTDVVKEIALLLLL